MSSAAKTAYVETGITLPTPVFSSLSENTITAPQSLTLEQVGHATTEGVYRGILVSWAKPAYGRAIGYVLMWRKDAGNYVTVDSITGTNYEIPSTLAGTYDVLVYAKGITNTRSPAVSGNIVVDLSSGTGSVLNPVTSFSVVGGGTSFVGRDLNVVWTNPATNDNLTAILKDFKVEVYDTSSNLLRTEYVGMGTLPGATATYSYTLTKNLEDGGPRRSVRIVVSARDTNNKTSTGNSVTFANPAPALLSDLALTAGIGSIKVTFTTPTESDFAGVLIWASTTTGFTPSEANLVYDGTANYFSHTSLNASDTWYYRTAAYDTFYVRDYTGAGLNISAQTSATVLMVDAGIPSYTSAPAGGVEGDFYYNTTDKHLYQHNGTTWANVAGDIVAGAVTTAMIAADAITTVKIAPSAITATEIATDAVTTPKIAANAVTAAEIAALTITANEIAAGTITGAKIAAGTITAGNITAGTITGTQIAADSIAASHIVAGTITSAEIATGTISAGNIATNAVTSVKIAADAVTADKISVSSLQAVTTNTGTLIVGSGGYLRSGQTAYNTGTGFYLGNVSGTPKFSIGVAGGNGLTWDGTTFTVAGKVGPITVATGGHVKMGQTAYNTGTGFFLGDSGGVAKFSVGSSAGDYLAWNGSALVIVGEVDDQRSYTAGTKLLGIDRSVSMSTSSTTQTIYENSSGQAITFQIDRAGTLRLGAYVDSASVGTGRLQWYRNGVAVGSETTFSNTTYAWVTVDSSGWSKGDLITVKIRTTNATYGVSIWGMKIEVGNIYPAMFVTASL